MWVWISKMNRQTNVVVLPDGKEGLEFRSRGLTFSIILETIQFWVFEFCKTNIWIYLLKSVRSMYGVGRWTVQDICSAPTHRVRLHCFVSRKRQCCVIRMQLQMSNKMVEEMKWINAKNKLSMIWNALGQGLASFSLRTVHFRVHFMRVTDDHPAAPDSQLTSAQRQDVVFCVWLVLVFEVSPGWFHCCRLFNLLVNELAKQWVNLLMVWTQFLGYGPRATNH